VTPDEALDLARDALDADLRSTRSWTPITRAALEAAVEGRRAWAHAWPEGAEHVPGLVAQDLQEALHESVDPRWPPCGEHSDHALAIEPDLGPDPFWVCEVTGLPIAPVGGL